MMILAIYKKKNQPTDDKRFYINQVSRLGIWLSEYNVDAKSAKRWCIKDIDTFNFEFEYVGNVSFITKGVNNDE